MSDKKYVCYTIFSAPYGVNYKLFSESISEVYMFDECLKAVPRLSDEGDFLYRYQDITDHILVPDYGGLIKIDDDLEFDHNGLDFLDNGFVVAKNEDAFYGVLAFRRVLLERKLEAEYY